MIILFAITLTAQNTFPSTGAAGIGTTAPNVSSLLEVKSTSKGILLPRMTQSQRNAIASPVEGLLIYQTDHTPGFYYYNGSAWNAVSTTGANKSLSNLTSPTAVNKSLIPGTSNTLDLGSSTNLWRKAYFGGDALINGLTVGLGNGGNGSNTALGFQALNSNTTGADNTAVGYQALQLNTSGSYNAATGVYALHNNINGVYNNAYGNAALTVNTSGVGNNAYGFYSLYVNSTGSYNAAYGHESLLSNTTGNNNSSFGTTALYSNTTGHSNVAIGVNTLFTNQTGSNLVAIGDSALHNNTVGGNTAIGSKALYANTSGVYNAATGFKGLYSNTTGSYNTANGYQTLYANISGYANTATGFYSLGNNTTGSLNTATGSEALFANTTGYYNTAHGYQTLYHNTSGFENTVNGLEALYLNTTGYDNTAVGAFADAYSNNNVGCSFFGSFTGNGSLGDKTDATAIGYYAVITASNQVRIGDNTITSIGGNVNWSNISDGRVKKNIKENVPGLSFINKLKPITYNLDLDAADKIIQRPEIKDKEGKVIQPSAFQIEARNQKQQIIYTGFIAQDVETAAKSLNYDFSGVDAAKNDKDLYGLRYAEFVVPLVKAVQELSKQNDDLKSEISDLKSQVELLQQNSSDAKPFKTSESSALQSSGKVQSILEQNIPNPFGNSTIIPFSIPQHCSSASIIITESSTGKTLKTIPVSCSDTQVKIDASEFSGGNYSYSLIVDGRVIDTKEMTLTK